jgi:hypothetical protein
MNIDEMNNIAHSVELSLNEYIRKLDASLINNLTNPSESPLSL